MMDQQARHPARGTGDNLSRRTMLQQSGSLAALAAAGMLPLGLTAMSPIGSSAASAELQPRDAFRGIFAAMERYPLVGVAALDNLQELHDFLGALLFHPALPSGLTDVVVEFGNALYQDLADRFILQDQPVAAADLAQIWRTTGDPLWDAPVFEQFYRNVRAINWMRPPNRRIRVLLGLPPFDPARVRGPADRAYLDAYEPQYDAHIAAVTGREVVARGRRALLVAGAGHLLRGLHADQFPHLPNAASLIVQRYPGSLFVVDTLAVSSAPSPEPAVQWLQRTLHRWPRPAVASLAGTWLGAVTQSSTDGEVNWGANRALTPAAARYEAQADAVLYLGPAEILTASRPDPAIYH
jgi:hypothetical protein